MRSGKLLEFRYYVIRRILMQIIVIWGMLSVSFFMMKAVPGDPVLLLVGEEAYSMIGGEASVTKYVEEIRHYWKLDRPIWEQYVHYVGNVLQGKLGRSILTNRDIIRELRTRFPATVELAVFGFLIAMAIAIPSGIISALHRGGKVDQIARIYSIFGVSAPNFWWGLLLLYIFYYTLRLPGLGFGRLSYGLKPPPFVTGMYTLDSLLAGRFDLFYNALSHLALPALAIGITSCGLTTRLTRSSLLEVLHKEYILTARMKGLKERIVIFRHALRNSLIPVVTYVGYMFGGMLGGSFLIETIFNYNGMGLLGLNAFLAKDFPAVLGIGVFSAIIFTTGNLIVDLLYGFIDPRVRYG